MVQGADLGMSGAEIAQEVVGGPAVMTSGLGTECSAEGIDSAIKDRDQTMLERKVVARGS